MYQPKHFQEENSRFINGLVNDNPLGTLILSTDGSFEVNHIPFVMDSDSSGIRKLRAHVPRTNSLIDLVSESATCVVVFQGAEGYITPSWYATKRKHGKVVPTWNYAVVHVHGSIRAVDDASWVKQQLEDLTNQNEMKRHRKWKISDAPSDFTASQLSVLVGLEVIAEKTEAKTKASQNQPQENQASILDSLTNEQSGSNLNVMMSSVLNKSR